MTKRVIYIAGADHSGSTLIGCLLGSNTSPFEYFHVGEIHAYFSKKHRLYGDLRHAQNKLCGQIWYNINPEVGYENAYEEIFRRTQSNVIIDSSKTHRNFDIIKSACLKKNYSLEIIVSFRPLAKIFKSDLNRNKKEENIKRNISSYLNIRNKIIDQKYQCTIVNVEQIILNPGDMTKRLCEKVDIPYFEGKENYWNYPSCHLYGSRTQRQHLKNPKLAKYDKDKVMSIPEINHPFLEREDICEVEKFLLKNALTCE
jgi:hypothetical protein